MDRDDVAVMRALARADALHSGQVPSGGLQEPFDGVLGPQVRRLFGDQLPRVFKMMGQPHTSSAGTAEIAQDSGGDSMSVNDASALQQTLVHIRQRYALFFNLPDGVEPGKEWNIDVALTPEALEVYPDAQVRYRRVYMTPALPPQATHPDTSVAPTAPMNYSQTG